MLYLKPTYSLLRYSTLQTVGISAVTPPALFCNKEKYPGSLYNSLYVVNSSCFASVMLPGVIGKAPAPGSTRLCFSYYLGHTANTLFLLIRQQSFKLWTNVFGNQKDSINIIGVKCRSPGIGNYLILIHNRY